MLSPLRALTDHVLTEMTAAMLGAADGERELEFFFPFPLKGAYTFLERVLMRTAVKWDPAETGVYIETSLRPFDCSNWKDADLFFQALGREVPLFVNSTYYVAEDAVMPDGVLYFTEDPAREGFNVPIFGTALPYEDASDRDALLHRFHSHVRYACCNLLLAHDVLVVAEQKGRELSAYERWQALMRAHGSAMVRKDERIAGKRKKKKSPPPLMFFPEGLYMSRTGFRERQFEELRPQ